MDGLAQRLPLNQSGAAGEIVVRGGVTLRAGPAREACFTVVGDQAEMQHVSNDEIGTPRFQREQLHENLNEEIQSLEIAAQSIADFPLATWDIRMHLARQCWDEARHARLFRRRLFDKGGRLGEFRIINQEWGVVTVLDSLAARIAVQNRIFEGGSLDTLRASVGLWSEWGDDETAAILDGILADEVEHSRFANDWLRSLGRRDPKAFLQAVSAMSHVRNVVAALAPAGKEKSDVTENTADRMLAGFTQ